MLAGHGSRAYWVPGVNNLGQYGRWAFAEFTSVYEIDADFDKLIQSLAVAPKSEGKAAHVR